jgi:ABC-type transport system substrate-binding protein
MYVEEIQVPEQSTRVAMLKTGDVDIAFPIDYDRLAELEAIGYRMEALGLPMISDLNFQATWLNTTGASGDIRIRQALSLAINRPELNATWYQGFAVPGGQFFMHRGSWGWSDALIPETNIAEAQALMAEAGYPQAFADPVIHVFCQAAAQDYMLVVMGYWEAAGFQTELKIIDTGAFWGALFARPKAGDWNVGWAWPWTSGSAFNSTYHCANMYTTRGIHGTSNDVHATELYDAYLAATDMVVAEQLWREFQQYVATLYIDIPIAEIEPKMPVGPNLGEFSGRKWMGIQEAYAMIKHPGQ